MSRPLLARWPLLVSIAASSLLGGCKALPTKPKEHSSASLLDTGPGTRVTLRAAADVQVAVGRAHEEGGRLTEAEASYTEALKKDPKRADAEARLAILGDRRGDAVAADLHFARALKLEPKNPEILCDRGYSQYLRRSWADAEASLNQAILLSPANPRAHNNLALVLARRGETYRALAEFARAGLDPADARSNLALVLAMEGHLDDAHREYATALADKPGSATAKEGLRASTVALASRSEPTPATDPALLRASNTSTH